MTGDTNCTVPGIEPVAPTDAKLRRLASLDLLRGLTVLGMIVVNASAALAAAGEQVFPILLHAKWAGFTAADTVFPAFITMVGVSVAVSARTGQPASARRIAWRSLRLVLLGMLLVNMYLPLAPTALWPPRLSGVLQRIGITYLVVALAYPRTTWSQRAIAAAILLLGYWGLCLLPIPGGMPVDLWVQGHNFASWTDREIFGNWIGERGANGYDPEGLLSTLPAIAEALIGTLGGELLRQGLPVARLSRNLAIAGVGGIVLGIAWNPWFPIAKPIWTSSFVLVTAGLTYIGLAVFHHLSDERSTPSGKGRPLGSFGRNAIAAYTLHLLLIQLLMTPLMRAPIAALTPAIGAPTAALVPVAIFLLIIWLPMAIADRRGWYVKI